MDTKVGRNRLLALALALLALGGLAAAAPAVAQDREFHGQVVRAGDNNLVVKNRMGDRRRFRRADSTRVEGKPSWKSLQKGDRVIVDYVRSGEHYEVERVIVLGAGD